MGYLANKKHEARINAFLKLFFILSAGITLLAFGSTGISLFFNEYRWQLYLLITAVFVYCVFRRFFIYALFAFILGTVNYFAVSSAVGVFGISSPSKGGINFLFGSESNGRSRNFVAKNAFAGNYNVIALNRPKFDGQALGEELSAKYSFLHPAEGWDNGFMLVSLPVEFSGRVNLGNGIKADFAKVITDNGALVVVVVDFGGLTRRHISSAFGNLSSFIGKQDDPVIIFGNFNTVAWSKDMSRFIADNGFKVKNALTDNIRNLFMPPKYYILGYEQNNVSGRLLLSRLNSFSMFTRF
uniref:Uncharacterized protein n=1 Tax=uncultured Alphaproteobacteria bacterium TaxID=91750 RepID=A0A6M4NQT1_9PROT|nr:hypothetical protein PlAlph_1590 [uncultured Alphaproteobacteria bacterium]